MSYELGTKPDREAGPIERVVLQEGLDEDEEDEEDIDTDADDAGSGGEDSDGRGGGENGVLGMSEEGRGGSGGTPEPNGTGNRSAAEAMAEAEAEVVDMSPEVGAMEAGGEGGHVGGSQGFRPEAEVVAGPEGLDYDSGSAKTMQQYQEGYWGKGYQSGSGGPGSGGEGGWGSTIRPSMAPRLSVDLINVDPVKELVKTVRASPGLAWPCIVALVILSTHACIFFDR